MKKLIAIAMMLGLAAPAVVSAAGNHTMAGCGLGYVLFGHGDNSKIMQILAATTNGTSGNQTFGMTTGTSGVRKTVLFGSSKKLKCLRK